MTEVIPAIIPQSFEDLKDRMSRVKGLTALVQIDIEDGVFVPSACWPYKGDQGGDFQKILNESEGFPFWESMDFEADLMIAHPETDAENFIKAGAKRIILHVESSPKMLDFVKELRKKYGYFGESAVSVEIGIGINIATPNNVLDEYLKPNEMGRTLADFIQFMGIDVIGYQEQRFDPVVLDKIEELRIKYPDTIISVDGGVNFENAHQLVHAGVNRLVSGSTLYNSDNMGEAIEKMKNS
jgi:ribulose-phosphate 3-epimerase